MPGLVGNQTDARLGNRDRTGGFGHAIGWRQRARGESEACHLGGESPGEFAVDGFAAIEREAHAAQVDVGDAPRVLADQAVGHVRCRRDGRPALGQPVKPPERRCLKRRRRRLPHVGAGQRTRKQEAQPHVVIERQPRAADVGRSPRRSRALSPLRLASTASGESRTVRGTPVEPAVPWRIATGAGSLGGTNDAERAMGASELSSLTMSVPPAADNRSRSAPWLRTWLVPMPANRLSSRCAPIDPRRRRAPGRGR